MKAITIALLVLAGCVDDAATGADLPIVGATQALPQTPVDPDRARCLEIIGELVPAPDIDTAIVPVSWGWSVAGGPWSRYNDDLAIVEDVFRYRGAAGALTIWLHDGVVTCSFREQIEP